MSLSHEQYVRGLHNTPMPTHADYRYTTNIYPTSVIDDVKIWLKLKINEHLKNQENQWNYLMIMHYLMISDVPDVIHIEDPDGCWPVE